MARKKYTSNFDLDTMIKGFLAKEFRNQSKEERLEHGFFKADEYSRTLVVLDEIIKKYPDVLNSLVIENKVYQNKDIAFFDYNDVWHKKVTKSN